MTGEDPSQWRCPNWHPDWDAPFEFEALRACASSIRSGADLDVRLDEIEEGYMRLEVFRAGVRTGLVYVNRSDLPSLPLFSVYAGESGEELHTTEINAVVTFLAARTSPFPDDPAEE